MLTVLVVLRTLVVAGALALVWRRTRRDRVAQPAWRSYRAGFVLLTACSLLEAVFVVAGTPVGAAGLVLAVPLRLASSVASFHLYRGVASWFRLQEKTRPAGRVDWLVGGSCILGATGVVNVLVDVPPGLAGLADQLRWLHVSSIVVLLSALVVAAWSMPRQIAGRARGIAVTVAYVLLTQVLYVVTGPRTDVVVAAWTGWVLLAVAFGALSLLPPATVPRRHPSAFTVPATSLLGLVLGLVAVVGAGLHVAPRHWALGFGTAAVAGSAVRLVRLVRDLADHDRARRQATTDDLTGLANRREFMGRLAAETARRHPLGVLLLDLDRFKEVNDQHGHAVGDELLAATAVHLERALPAGALLARLGGDEFAAILPGADVDAAVAAAADMLTAVAAVDVSASVGVATSTGADALSGTELLRRADASMYAAKGGGLGVAVHDDDADRAWRARVELSDELLLALGPDAPASAAEQFEVHYQPQVDTADEVVGVEALVRWRHPRHGLLAPGAFLDVVEERGLLPALTVHVARRAVRDLAGWHAAGHDLRLAVNTSSTYLADPELLRLLDELVAGGTDAGHLVVEVTETSLMNDPDRALATCHEITARGVALSIDDFGTGYSSLAYLANLPATEVKVDRTFTSRALQDERIAAIVAGTVELAHHLGLRVVAEGVEDPATLDLLRRLGCDESQGYLHSRPVPAGEFLCWLQARSRPRTPARAQL
ncbi:putative bifunctional diguanylate cyclase/phosphodiesterase [Kineococcus rhizosphaerae]|uniref:Diguanylate cyclase (GGDEF)-like protein n=1 Tax=Kineococcus rhizosphaerae TaxID=559628 RepID=A0A2T0R381_9ACTN|nr:bifunctional diguanylate cyclase/phosphodiesterase [Kineococcus rhizosphaerae]PRY14495.1 diguanylate cyclase (GGDEF)-like protein [Kineococcus rhizosphaerae]